MKQISFLTLGLLAAASLFGAEDLSDESSLAKSSASAESNLINAVCINVIRVTPPDIDTINKLTTAIHANHNNPLEQERCVAALMDQPIAQITVMGLAQAMHHLDAEAWQSLCALMSEAQSLQAAFLFVNEAQEATQRIFCGSRTEDAFKQSVNMMCGVYLDFKQRRIGGGSIDKTTGHYVPDWPVGCNDWVDIVELCSCIALSDPRDRSLRLDLAHGLVHNQMAQFITYNLALGTTHKNSVMAEMLFNLLPRAEKIKKARLATAIAHAYATYEQHYDQFHAWTQVAITEAPSWRPMLDMVKHRAPVKVTENELSDLSTTSESVSATSVASDVSIVEKPEPNRYALLYWHAQAERAGWVDAEKQKDLEVLYADIDREADERRASLEAQQQKEEAPEWELGIMAQVLADIQMLNETNDSEYADVATGRDCSITDVQSKQKSSFKDDIAAVLENEERDDYNPAILEARLAKEGDDVWRDLRMQS